jgi:uncharacterized protein YlxP (DUF503 family)
MATKIGVLRMHIYLPGSDSLKAKRKRLKPIIARLHREFNVSVSEVDMNDKWADSVLGCALISTDTATLQRSLQKIAGWLDKNWPDIDLMGEEIEVIQ